MYRSGGLWRHYLSAQRVTTVDLLSLGVILLILVASGGIAFVADGLGKKIGKKRLSVFNLRPKHVASLGTVLMGVVVSFLTILFIAAVSRDAREWLIEGRGLLVERGRLIKEKEGLEADVRKLHVEGTQAEGRNRDLQGKVSDAKSNLVRVEAQSARLKADNDRLQASIDRVRGELAGSKSELSRNRTALERANSQLASANARLAEYRPQIEDYNAQIRTKRTELARAAGDLRTTKGDLTTARKSLGEVTKQKEAIAKKSFQTYQKSVELEAQVAEYQKKVDDLQSQVGTREALVDSLRKTTEELVAQRNATEEQYAKVQESLARESARLENFKDFLDSAVKASRQEPLTFGAGEEVARITVPGGTRAKDADAALRSLLRTARVVAEGRGAKGHKAGVRTFEVADVMDRLVPETETRVTADALKQVVVDSATGRVQDMVLVATSSLNAFRGEPVALDIAVLPNPMVYRRNETVAEARIDGSLAEDRILGQLSDFVGNRVRERAVQDQMIPRANTAAPFGEVPPLDVLSLVRDVKKAGRTVRVQALAGKDTHAADSLKLEFKIR